MPLRSRRQDGPVRRGRRRQDRRHSGAHRPHRHQARRLFRLCRRRRADPRGQRPVARNAANHHPGHQRHGAGPHHPGLRADERAARGPTARRPGGHDHRRVFPRQRHRRHSAVHRQHLPFRPGRLGSIRPAGPHPVRRGLPADAGHGNGPAPGADRVHQDRVHHVRPGDLRAGGRPDRPRPGDDLRPLGLLRRARAGHHAKGHLPRGRSAGEHLPHSRPEHRRPATTTTSPKPCWSTCSATASCRISSRFSASTS